MSEKLDRDTIRQRLEDFVRGVSEAFTVNEVIEVTGIPRFQYQVAYQELEVLRLHNILDKDSIGSGAKVRYRRKE